MPNYDEELRFKDGGDVGDNTSASVQPINNAEYLVQDNINRSIENIRKRIEKIRGAIQDLNYYSDYDRNITIRCDWDFTLNEPLPGIYQLTASGAGDLEIFPTLSPGLKSGGRWFGGRAFINDLPYFGTFGVNELTLRCHSLSTGMRGYADGQDFATEPNSVTLGANGIDVDLIAEARPGGPLTVIFEVSELPKRRIKIKYGTAAPATTLADLITAINTDYTSQGSYGVGFIFKASTTVLAPALVTPTPGLNARVQGAYDAEVHKITLGQFNAFFAISDNYMQDGEGLAIGFPLGLVEKGPAVPTGGRRQSLVDLPIDRNGNTTNNTSGLINGGLFNTGREPEKIPGAIPIGKMARDKFTFIDGTILGSGDTTNIGGNGTLLAMLASQLPTTGADLIGYGGSGNWHAFDGGSLPPSTVEQAIDNIVFALANQLGARKIGTDGVIGTPLTGNLPLNLLLNFSLQQQLIAILNNANGVNHRVHENGHYLQTLNPIQKRMDSILGNGGRRFQAVLKQTDTIVYNSNSPIEYADLILQPVVKTGVLNLNEPVIAGTGVSDMKLNAGDIAARFPNIWPLFPYVNVYPEADALSVTGAPMVFVEIKGLIPGGFGDGDGIYIFDLFTLNAPDREFRLRKLDGSYPNFTGAIFTTATVTFLHGMSIGNSQANGRVHLFNANEANGGAAINLLSGSPNGVLMECYYTDPASFPSVAKKGMVIRGDRIVFQPLVGNPKSTDDILTTADYNLLKGVETGTPVDATTNHHHGSVYHGFRDQNANLLGTLSNPHTPGTQTFTVTNLAGYTEEYAVIYIYGDVKAAAAGSVTFQLELRKPAGNNVAGVAIEFTAAAPAETRKLRLQAVVPVSLVRNFEVEKLGLTNIDPTTVINVTEAFIITGKS